MSLCVVLKLIENSLECEANNHAQNTTSNANDDEKQAVGNRGRVVKKWGLQPPTHGQHSHVTVTILSANNSIQTTTLFCTSKVKLVKIACNYRTIIRNTICKI